MIRPKNEQLTLLAQQGFSDPSRDMPLPGNGNAVDRSQHAAYSAALLPDPEVGLRSRPRAGIGRPHCRCPATAYPYLDPKSPAVQAMSAVRSWVGSLVITVNSRPWCTTG